MRMTLMILKKQEKLRRISGFTMVELLTIVAILSVLTMVALPTYNSAREKVRVGEAKADLIRISLDIQRYYADQSAFPPDLEATSFDITDPWGNDYQYLNMASVQGNGAKRKDRNQVPLNTDYDLYSKGPDGESASPLTAKQSKDDIIRADNGRFIGTAEEHSY